MNLFQCSLIVFSLLAVSRSAPFAWQPVNSNNPPPPSRSNAGVVVHGDYLYTFGGEGLEQQPSSPNASTIRSDMWRIRVNGGTSDGWEDITSQVLVRPPAQYGFISGLIDDHWIISHGCGANENCFSDTWAFNFNTLRWQLVNVTPPMELDTETDEMPTMMMNMTQVLPVNVSTMNGSDLVMNGSNITELMADNETLGDYFPQARRNTAGGIYPGTTLLWLSMGVSETRQRRLSDTWVLNISIANLTGEWQLVSRGVELNQYDPFMPHARSHLAGAPLDGGETFVIFGGCASGGQVGGPCPMQDAWQISLDEREWVELPQCPSPRNGATMVPHPSSPNKAILWGGNEDGPGVFPQKISGPDYNSSFVYVLDLGTGNNASWVRNLATGSPVPRPREGVHFTRDGSGVLYIYGGRTVGIDPIFMSDLWRLRGDGNNADDFGCPSPTFSFVHLHGTLMYLAWGLLLPLGALLARYYRWTWPCWFILHVICQSAGILLTVAGFVVIFLVGSWDQPNFPHAMAGIVLTAFLILQYLTGIFHPCVESENGKTPFRDKSCYRVCWEIYHGFSGFIAVALGFGQIMLGLLLVVPPMIVWVVWAGLGGLWILVFFLHEIVYLACKIKNRKDD